MNKYLESGNIQINRKKCHRLMICQTKVPFSGLPGTLLTMSHTKSEATDDYAKDGEPGEV